jgi:hypothetical protein
MEGAESAIQTELKPPYGNVKWYHDFFELIRKKPYDVFGKDIIELNIIKGANATMLFNGLRFLGLLEENGKVTEKFESLRRVGDEFKENLKKVVTESYSLLFSKVDVESAKPDTLFNFFSEYYKCGKSTASLSTKIFIYLCQEAGIPLSQDLMAGEMKVERGPRKKREQKEIVGKEGTFKAPEGMHKIEWGDSILMFLRSGDKNTREKIAKNAQKLIEMYVEGEES